MNNNEWKLPLNLAIGLHVLLVLAVIFMPGLFHTRPILPETYTVNLVSMSPAQPKTGAAGPKAEPAPRKVETARPEVKIKPVEIKKPEPVVRKEIVPPPPVPVVKKEAAPATPPVSEEKAISLKPLKRKIQEEAAYDALINERLHRLQMQEKRQQEREQKRRLEQIHRQRVAESIRAEQTAEQEARIAADEVKQLLRSTASVKSTNTGTGSPNSGSDQSRGESSNLSPIENQYFAAITNRIQQFWALPEYKNWDPSLTATVVITINQDGTITSQSFEKRSGDKVFDQFVEKALRDAVPLPQIPAALKKSQIDIGLHFSPKGLQ